MKSWWTNASALICVLVALPAQASTTPDEKPAVLELTERLRGGRPVSPLERSLESVIQAAYQAEGEGGGGGSTTTADDEDGESPDETPETGETLEDGDGEAEPMTVDEEEATTELDAPSTADARYEAFQEFVAKNQALDAVKAALWFVVLNPDNPHNPKVQETLQTQARALSDDQRADLEAFQSARAEAQGLAPKKRGRQLDKWADKHESNTFAASARREAKHARTVASREQEEAGERRSRWLVRIGVIGLVLLLVGVVLIGGT